MPNRPLYDTEAERLRVIEKIEHRPPTDCPTCGSERFWQRSGFKTGKPRVSAKCRKCHRASLAKDRAKHGGAANRNKRWEAFNREKMLAHKLVEQALVTGKIKRGRCERCGSFRAHAHHDDYSKPLEVMWLCPLHHKERHREIEYQALGAEASG